MSSTVQIGGFEISGNNVSAEEMVKELTPPEPKSKLPVIKMDRGQPVEQKDEDAQKASDAARELGKRGGDAAAKARQERIDQQEKRAEQEMAKEAKLEEKAEAKETEKPAEQEKPKGEGDPRHDPEARVRRATEQAAADRRALEQERAERKAAMERIERLERLAESLSRGERPEPAKAQPKERPAAADGDDPEPQEGDFDDYKSFVRALGRWSARQEHNTLRAKDQEQTQATERERLIGEHRSGFAKALREAQQSEPDLLPKLDEEGRQIPGSGKIDHRLLEMQTSYQELEDAKEQGREPGFGPSHMLADWFTHPPEAVARLKYLTEHPKAVEAFINAPNPLEASRILGRIEAQLDAERGAKQTETPKRETSSAPPPIRPVTASATPGAPDYTKEMEFDRFAAIKGMKPKARR